MPTAVAERTVAALGVMVTIRGRPVAGSRCVSVGGGSTGEGGGVGGKSDCGGDVCKDACSLRGMLEGANESACAERDTDGVVRGDA